MKRLLLLRHAKSSWNDPALEDRDRPLAPRGRKAAPRMGRELVAQGWLPQFALVSPAARSRETWALVAAELPAAPEATFPEALYLASPAGLLAELRGAPAAVETLLLLGHNPGLERLARALAGPGSGPVALAALHEKFPTAALAVLELEGEWAALGSREARLTHLLRPKELKSGVGSSLHGLQDV